ncbi:MAG: hypothetical protein JWQ90_4883 [Hydrocarboniphaga sp.]|uniref:hypothetical protein n=1 Tax=Hydrocarboniphaga sp. TaxID=2033016 RepID=UPI00262B56CF|nr:hypothetical protein [Hydrocarboniphaga sp.]MDB5972433.1 hypothetical protein [Hydrocarboniphaga sp.]
MKPFYVQMLLALLILLNGGCRSTPVEDRAAPASAPVLSVTAIDAAMQEGADFARPCGNQIDHDGAAEFVDCVRVRARLVRRQDALDDARSLGVWYVGWLLGEINGGFGVEDAQAGADEFLPRLLQLQKQIGVEDARFCALLPTSCERMIARKREAASGIVGG